MIINIYYFSIIVKIARVVKISVKEALITWHGFLKLFRQVNLEVLDASF